MILTIYRIGFELVTWLALVPWTIVRRAIGRASASELAERLGWPPDAPPAGSQTRRILIHAVSVGEMAAAGGLVRSLERRRPGVQIMLTAGNRHGLEAARRIAATNPRVIGVSYLPWDRSRAIARWLARLRPDLIAVVETEIWPNLFLACRQAGVRLCMVNGRIYPADLPRYRLARRFFRRALECVDWLGVQSEKDRDRFVEIGADPHRIDVEANLKYDAIACVPAIPRPFPPGKRVLLAGSTHAPEERLLIDIVVRLRKTSGDLLLVLAPRRPARARAIARQARRAGLAIGFTSQGARGEECDALIVDQMGLLPSLYQHADLVFVGGTLARRGGQNPLEPAAAGRFMVMGPNYQHFEDIVHDLLAANGLIVVPSPAILESTLLEAIGNESLRATVGRNAQAAVQARAGCADRYAEALAALLELRRD